MCAVHLMCVSMWREDNLKSSSSGTMHLTFEVEFFNGSSIRAVWLVTDPWESAHFPLFGTGITNIH